jgi:hypothetical protein
MAATLGIQREFSSRLPPDEAIQRYLTLVSDSFRASKWFPINQSPSGVTFGRERFHAWQIALAILLFPLGLLALLAAKEHHWVTATFVGRGNGTAIAMTGAVPSGAQVEALLDHVQQSIDADLDVPSAARRAS